MLRLTIVLFAVAFAAGVLAAHPRVGPQYGEESVEGFIDFCEYPMSLSEEEMLSLVPEKNGMALIGCPNCPPSRPEGRFEWDPHRPNQIVCERCGHVFPSDKYPAEGVHEVTTPAGNTIEYRYWEREDGYRYYFGARIAKDKQQYMIDVASKMAHIYHYTQRQEYAHRAALIINRFAEVYPDYIYKYEMPFRQKILYDGDIDPNEERGWRSSRWEWWGYKDIPDRLIRAYDLIYESGQIQKIPGAQERILNDFFLVAADTVMHQNDTFHNMSPTAYREMILTGRVLQRPKYIHEAVDRVQKMCTRRFFYDGSWYEGAPSYHRQVIGGLDRVFDMARGYSDPEGYTHPETGKRFDDLEIAEYVPEVKRAQQALADMRLPNGRAAPLHDTWSHTRSEPLERSEPVLFGGLGHAKLGRGERDNQMQLHLTWSAGYGHRHYDGLSMLLFAKGKELLSDLGYTHTRYDGYKRATVSHNTVVVDMSIQKAMGEPCAEGKLLFFDAADPDMQVVSVDNTTCYPEKVQRYERTMALVGINDRDGYVLDRFIVKSPHQQDYFLHGSADEPQSVTVLGEDGKLQMEPVETMVPEELDWEPPVAANRQSLIHKRGWSYGLLWDNAVAHPGAGVQQARFTYHEDGPVTNVFFITEQDDEVYTGTDPQIRPAKEDDALVDQFKRPHFMIRRPGGEEANVFLSVIEPADEAGHIRSVSVM
ncbi:MAG: heparinase II/III family protein, partial [Armatimonadota bacterium]